MTEKKSRFVSYQLVTDLFASLIFALTVLTVIRMAALYEGIIDLSFLQMYSVLLLPELFVFVRRLRIKLIPMVLLHVLPVAAYLSAMAAILTYQGRRSITSGLLYLGFMAALNLIYSMFWRFRKASISAVTHDMFVASMALHLILVLVSRGNLRQAVMLNVFLVVCVYLIARQLYTFDANFAHNTQSSNRSVRQTQRQNYMNIFFIAGGIILALLLLTTIPISTISASLHTYGVKIGNFFSRLLPEPSDSAPNEPMELSKPMAGDGHEPFFVQIFFVLFSVVIVCAFLVAVFKAFHMFLKHFHMESPMEINRSTEDAVVDIIEEIYEEEPRPKEKDFGEGQEREIREKYYSTVQKAIRSGTRIDPSFTPEQIESALKEKGDPSLTELTPLYESVRYGKKNNEN